MEKVRKLLVLLGCLIFLLSLVGSTWASGFELNPISDHIGPKEKAYFSMNITNTLDREQTYQIFSLELSQWNVEPFPLKDKVIVLQPGESYSVQIAATPLKDFNPGIYYISISADGDKGSHFEGKMKVYLAPAEAVMYSPSVKPTITAPEKINPQEPVSIKLLLENRNALNLSNLRIRLESEMAEFNKLVPVDLEPLQKKEVEITVIPNKYQQPKSYVVKFVFERYGEDFKTVELPIEVMTMIPGFSVVEVYEEPVFLKNFRRFTIKNEGNVLNTQEVKYPVSFLDGLLTQGEAQVKKEIDQRYLAWSVSLGGGESTFVYSVTNYRILLYIFIILVAFLVFYLYVRSPVSIKKTAVSLKKDSEGALSEVKVMLEVKNTSSHPLKEVVVYDLIPGYATLLKTGEKDKEGEVESAHPHKVSHIKEGIKLSWPLMDLDAKEQRIMVYRLKAKLNILGGVSLPRATAEFHRKSGRRGKAYSGVFKLGGK